MRRKTRLISAAISALFSVAVRADTVCPQVNLGSQPPLQGLDYTPALYKQLKRNSQLNFVPVFRETTDQDKHFTVMETNPHFKSDVRVCLDHQVTVYIGLYPYSSVPKFTDKPLPAIESFLPDARDPDQMLSVERINLKPVCKSGDAPITPDMMVLQQFPEAGQKLRFYFQGNKPKQAPAWPSEVLLYVDCAQKQCIQGDCPAAQEPLAPDNSPPTQYSVVHVTSAAAGGATLAYFLSVGALGAAASPQKVQISVPDRTLSVRVRAVADIP